jgi:Type I phosphodiesterase / nucleotide pyrophosphatase
VRPSTRSVRITATLAALGLSALAPAASQAQAPADSGGPLTYVFVIDGLDGDRVDAGRAPRLSALLAGEGARATYFKESRSVMVAETNPNHIAMATGAYTDKTGIPGNSFAVYGTPADAESCPTGPVDESQPSTQTSGLNPECLRVPTMFESVERSAQRDSIVTAGIFGKPKLARIFSGRKADPGRYDADYLWTPCGDGSTADYCKSGVPARPGDAYAQNDADVMSEVMRTVREGVPGDGKTFTGGGKRPSLTFANFPQVDATGHINGAGSEYDVAIDRADEQIARFVAQQKQLGLWERTVMVVLSDHSMDSTPEQTLLADRFTAAGIPTSAYRIVRNGSAALIYLSDRTSPGRFALLKQMRDAATDTDDALSQTTGPAAVEAYYREPNPAEADPDALTLAKAHPNWRLGGDRVGDLVVTSRVGRSFDNPASFLRGNHGGPQTRDNFFAVLGGAPTIRQQVVTGTQDLLFDDTAANPQQAENVDVAPTVLALLGRPAPSGADGRVLTNAFQVVPGPTPVPAPPGTPGPPACAAGAGFASASVRASGRRGLRFSFSRQSTSAVSVDLFQVSEGSRILGSRRVARFTNRTRSFTWNGRSSLADGIYYARLRVRSTGGVTDTRRIALTLRDGRFRSRAAFSLAESCGTVAAFSLGRPVFGGRGDRALSVSYRLGADASVRVELLRGARVVRRIGTLENRRAGATTRVRIPSAGLRAGEYRVRLRVTRAGRTTSTTLGARKL